MAGLPGSSRGINKTEAMGCTIWSLSPSTGKVQGFHRCWIERRWRKSHKRNVGLDFLDSQFLQHPPATEYEQHQALSESRDIHNQQLHNTTQNLLCTQQPEKKPLLQLPHLKSIFPWQLRRLASPLATLNHFKGIYMWHLTPSFKIKIVKKCLLYSSA